MYKAEKHFQLISQCRLPRVKITMRKISYPCQRYPDSRGAIGTLCHHVIELRLTQLNRPRFSS